jgi:hypothetical protein
MADLGELFGVMQHFTNTDISTEALYAIIAKLCLQMTAALLTARVRSGLFTAADFPAWAELLWATLEPGEAAATALRADLAGVAWLPAAGEGLIPASSADDTFSPVLLELESSTERTVSAVARLNMSHRWLPVLAPSVAAAASRSPRIARVLRALGVQNATLSGALAAVAADVFARVGHPRGAADSGVDFDAIAAAGELARELAVTVVQESGGGHVSVTSTSGVVTRLRLLACFRCTDGELLRSGTGEDEAAAVRLGAPGYVILPRRWLHVPASALPAGAAEMMVALEQALRRVADASCAKNSTSSLSPLWCTVDIYSAAAEVSAPSSGIRSSRTKLKSMISAAGHNESALSRNELTALRALGVEETFCGFPCRKTNWRDSASSHVSVWPTDTTTKAEVSPGSAGLGSSTCAELFYILDTLCKLPRDDLNTAACIESSLRAVASVIRLQLDLNSDAGVAVASGLASRRWLPADNRPAMESASVIDASPATLNCGLILFRPCELVATWLREKLGNRALYAPHELLSSASTPGPRERDLASHLGICSEMTPALAAKVLTALAAAGSAATASMVVECPLTDVSDMSSVPLMLSSRVVCCGMLHTFLPEPTDALVTRLPEEYADHDLADVGCPTAATSATFVVDERLLGSLYSTLNEDAEEVARLGDSLPLFIPHATRVITQDGKRIGRFAFLREGCVVHDDSVGGAAADAGLVVTWSDYCSKLYRNKSPVAEAVNEWSHTNSGETHAWRAALDRVEAWGAVVYRNGSAAARERFGRFLGAFLAAATATAKVARNKHGSSVGAANASTFETGARVGANGADKPIRTRFCIQYLHKGALPLVLPVTLLSSNEDMVASVRTADLGGELEDARAVTASAVSLLRVCDTVPSSAAEDAEPEMRPRFLLDDDPVTSAAAARFYARLPASSAPVYLVQLSILPGLDHTSRLSIGAALSALPGVLAFSGHGLHCGVAEPGMQDFSSRFGLGPRRAWALACSFLQSTLQSQHKSLYGREPGGPPGVREALLGPVSRTSGIVFVPSQQLRVAYTACNPVSNERLVIFTKPEAACLLFGDRSSNISTPEMNMHAKLRQPTLFIDTGVLLTGPASAWCGAAIDVIVQCLRGGDPNALSVADIDVGGGFNAELKRLQDLRADLLMELEAALPDIIAAPALPQAAIAAAAAHGSACEALWFLPDDLLLPPPSPEVAVDAAAAAAMMIAGTATSATALLSALGAAAEPPPFEAEESESSGPVGVAGENGESLNGVSADPCSSLNALAAAEALRLDKLRAKIMAERGSSRWADNSSAVGGLRIPAIATSGAGLANDKTDTAVGSVRFAGGQPLVGVPYTAAPWRAQTKAPTALSGSSIANATTVDSANFAKTVAPTEDAVTTHASIACSPVPPVPLSNSSKDPPPFSATASSRFSTGLQATQDDSGDTFGLRAVVRNALIAENASTMITNQTEFIGGGRAAWGDGTDSTSADDPARADQPTYRPLQPSVTQSLPPPIEVPVLHHPDSALLASIASKDASAAAESCRGNEALAVATGRAGEALVYGLLLAHCARVNADSAASVTTVSALMLPVLSAIWVNEKFESGLPYDIRLELSAPAAVGDASTPRSSVTALYVEVKSTLAPRASGLGCMSARFHMSAAEASWAYRHAARYQLALVLGLASARTVQVFRVRGSPKLPLIFELPPSAAEPHQTQELLTNHFEPLSEVVEEHTAHSQSEDESNHTGKDETPPVPHAVCALDAAVCASAPLVAVSTNAERESSLASGDKSRYTALSLSL